MEAALPPLPPPPACLMLGMNLGTLRNSVAIQLPVPPPPRSSGRQPLPALTRTTGWSVKPLVRTQIVQHSWKTCLQGL